MKEKSKNKPEKESSMLIENPKLAGTIIVDIIPQKGKCPLKCQECFYNAPGFYRPKTEPKLPTDEEIRAINEAKKIVRVNSGHDSNVQRGLVIRATEGIENKFYNTSVPEFDFPGPVVFTCNGKDTDLTFYAVEDISNLMYVRIRVNAWNLESVTDRAVKHYTSKGVPVVLTFMRYADKQAILCPNDYYEKKSILNTYQMINVESWQKIMARYKDNHLVFSCGTAEISYCRHCLNCARLYYVKKDKVSLPKI